MYPQDINLLLMSCTGTSSLHAEETCNCVRQLPIGREPLTSATARQKLFYQGFLYFDIEKKRIYALRYIVTKKYLTKTFWITTTMTRVRYPVAWPGLVSTWYLLRLTNTGCTHWLIYNFIFVLFYNTINTRSLGYIRWRVKERLCNSTFNSHSIHIHFFSSSIAFTIASVVR